MLVQPGEEALRHGGVAVRRVALAVDVDEELRGRVCEGCVPTGERI